MTEFEEAKSSSAEDDGFENSPCEFCEGELYDPDDIPESDDPTGKLVMIGDGKYGALYGEHYVTFEVRNFVCTDVTHQDDVGGLGD